MSFEWIFLYKYEFFACKPAIGGQARGDGGRWIWFARWETLPSCLFSETKEIKLEAQIFCKNEQYFSNFLGRNEMFMYWERSTRKPKKFIEKNVLEEPHYQKFQNRDRDNGFLT